METENVNVPAEANVQDNLLGTIDIAVANYLDGKGDIGGIACHAIVHTLKTGDVNPIQRMFQALPAESREQKRLKVFIGHATRFKNADSGEVIPCLSFSEGKFKVRPNTGNYRGAMWENAQGLYDALGNFLDFMPPKKAVDPNIEKLLKMVKTALSNAATKADEFGAKIPDGVKAEMAKLKDMIEVTLPQVKGIANHKV